uniref:RNA-directed DNA polymerase, eukaryota, reverse transcriptase zinc-binding domain protein n=1 Tax=Tanacetum cinerariifolium TaxID=118510 RepID=A0A6L2KVA1_TANCI|nr:RNA-directed DNA polymerase, eukaryota, reverse transcriptase zinc-binding domain protein [Tanacetum cinerariifolium]
MSYHLYVLLSRFQISNIKTHTLHNVSTNDNNTKPKPNHNPKNNIPNHKDLYHDKHSFASVVPGNLNPNGVSSTSFDKVRSISLDDHDLITVEDSTKVLLVKLKEVDAMSNMYRICKNKDFIDVKIHHVGGRWVWILFPSEASCANFQTNSSMKSLSSSIRSVSPSFKVDERMTAMCSSRVCICTKSYNFISEKVQVEVHGETFDVQVHKIGIWSINIVDESLDTSSSVDVNALETVDDSVKDNLVDDLNELNDMLKDLPKDNNEEEVNTSNNFDNHVDAQTQFNKKEAVFNVSQPSNSNDSSKLSRSLGFEHMKRSSKSKMTRLEILHLKSMWGNYSFDYACSMARGISRGLISMWDPNSFVKENIWCDEAFTIVKGHWKNRVGDCFMARDKWDIEGDENSKFFHRLVKQKRRAQMIHVFPQLIHFSSLSSVDREDLELDVSLDEIEKAVWDCGSDKALGPDGFTFAFVKKYWEDIKLDIFKYVNTFFAFGSMPHGSNSSVFTLISKEVVLPSSKQSLPALDVRKLAWIKWHNVLSSFKKGGLNIGSLKSFNLALLQKWRWRMSFNPQYLWVKVIKALHGYEGGFNLKGCYFNGNWAKIVGSSNFLQSKGVIPSNSLRYRVGCGMRIHFWKDTWIGDTPLWIHGQWHWRWSRQVLGVRTSAYLRDMLNEISQVTPTDVKDSCVWRISNDGVFSVGVTRRHIDENLFPRCLILQVGTIFFRVKLMYICGD